MTSEKQIHVFDLEATEWTAHLLFPQIQIKLLESQATHAHASIMLVQLAVGGVIDPHQHEIETETAILLRGEAELTADGEATMLTARQGVSIPPKVVHSLRNTGSEALELLAIHTPPAR
ncbi:MAG: cupin domain-containing protein [Anaerolineae bacterium]|nr:cupin domain-containing protein [Anaerolineae bacterium]